MQPLSIGNYSIKSATSFFTSSIIAYFLRYINSFFAVAKKLYLSRDCWQNHSKMPAEGFRNQSAEKKKLLFLFFQNLLVQRSPFYRFRSARKPSFPGSIPGRPPKLAWYIILNRTIPRPPKKLQTPVFTGVCVDPHRICRKPNRSKTSARSLRRDDWQFRLQMPSPKVAAFSILFPIFGSFVFELRWKIDTGYRADVRVHVNQFYAQFFNLNSTGLI